MSVVIQNCSFNGDRFISIPYGSKMPIAVKGSKVVARVGVEERSWVCEQSSAVASPPND